MPLVDTPVTLHHPSSDGPYKCLIIVGVDARSLLIEDQILQIGRDIYGEAISAACAVLSGGNFYLGLEFRTPQKLKLGDRNKRVWRSLLTANGVVFANTVPKSLCTGHHEAIFESLLKPFLDHGIKVHDLNGEPYLSGLGRKGLRLPCNWRSGNVHDRIFNYLEILDVAIKETKPLHEIIKRAKLF